MRKIVAIRNAADTPTGCVKLRATFELVCWQSRYRCSLTLRKNCWKICSERNTYYPISFVHGVAKFIYISKSKLGRQCPHFSFRARLLVSKLCLVCERVCLAHRDWNGSSHCKAYSRRSWLIYGQYSSFLSTTVDWKPPQILYGMMSIVCQPEYSTYQLVLDMSSWSCTDFSARIRWEIVRDPDPIGYDTILHVKLNYNTILWGDGWTMNKLVLWDPLGYLKLDAMSK